MLYALVVPAMIGVVYGILALRTYLRTRGARLIQCPTTKTTARVEVDAVRAALFAAPDWALTVRDCSLWPERKNCVQWCCDGISSSKRACGAWDVFTQWSVGKQCTLCRRDIPPVARGAFTPGLLSPQGRLIEWTDVPFDEIFQVLATHEPVCTDCDVVDNIRRRRRQPSPPAA